MDNSINNISEKLVQYLDGELPGRAKEDIEKQLASDSDLQNELENLQLARGVVRSYGLKQRVGSIHQQMMNELQTPVKKISSARRIIRYGIAIAASVLFVILGSVIYNSNSVSSDKLFAENYHSYEVSITRDGGTTEKAIEKAYKGKDYKQVTVLGDTSENNLKDIFLSAMAYMELKNDIKAIEEYKKVIAKNESAGTNILKDEAEYYLALAFLHNKDYDHALEMMNKIHNDPNHIYNEKITAKLINEVKSLR
jgi:tetratricopeptide (TPR) repeat protein